MRSSSLELDGRDGSGCRRWHHGSRAELEARSSSSNCWTSESVLITGPPVDRVCGVSGRNAGRRLAATAIMAHHNRRQPSAHPNPRPMIKPKIKVIFEAGRQPPRHQR